MNSDPLLTLFTAPKPFEDAHISMIQENAIKSWQQLGEQVQIVVIGDETGLAEACQRLGVLHLPGVARSVYGTPLVSSIFSLARGVNRSPFLTYLNADIILFPDFLEQLIKVSRLADKFLMVGQRYDLAVTEPIDFSEGWEAKLRERMKKEGKLHKKTGSDYFAYPRNTFDQIPEFAVGRAGWDNWMIYRARRMHWTLVDASPSVEIIHQDHDYAHLPGGQKHYRLPESGENIILAGGRRTIFDLHDATHLLVDGQLVPVESSWSRFWRELEIAPLVERGNYKLTQFLFMLLHPVKAWKERKKEREMKAKLMASRQGGH